MRLPLRVPIAEREDALKTRTLTLAAAALVALLGVLAVATAVSLHFQPAQWEIGRASCRERV